MQRMIDHDDLEVFLKQSADQVLMQPSSAVWKNISKDLNKKNRRRRWFAFVVMLMIISSGGGYLLLNSLNPSTEVQTALSNATKTIPTSPLPDNQLTEKSTVKSEEKQIALKPVNKSTNSKKGRQEQTPLLLFNSPVSIPEGLIADAEESIPLLRRPTDIANKVIIPQAKNILAGSMSMREPDAVPTMRINMIVDSVSSKTAGETVAGLKSKERKLSWQVFVTPNISYRRLSENKSYAWPATIPQGISYLHPEAYNVNSAVTHKPDIGVEFGFTTKYSIAKNIKIRSGFQFNVNRYNVKAFSYRPEVATISLNNGYRIDYVNTVSNYRNFNGSKTSWLENYYFQATVPVGAEIKLAGNNKMHVGIASTVQPTYIIGDRAYLITNDYKNYAELPWLIRRWNVNTSMETFVSYTSGKTKWQVGPQVRYQLLSSFVSKYPVKENLFDFGLKVGVTFNQR